MCILFLAINQHPNYPLVIAANRDEYYKRPSQRMGYWPDHPNILAGRDLEKMGSWLGVNMTGKFCAVTNFRTARPLQPDKRSRGRLIASYLKENSIHDDFVSTLEKEYSQYNPFNLVFGDQKSLSLFCSENGKLENLPDGYHSISNGYYDDQWPKMSAGVNKLTQVVEKSQTIDMNELNKILMDKTKASDHQLPQTGASKEFEKFASSIFINSETYGTRSSTCLLFSSTEINIHETNYEENGVTSGNQEFLVTL